MTATSLLPPAYLLPAWTHCQLALYRANLSDTCRRKQFSAYSKSRSSSGYDNAQSASNTANQQQHASSSRQFMSHGERRRSRFERSNNEIRERLLRKSTTLIKKYPLRDKHEKVEEAKVAAVYNEKQSYYRSIRDRTQPNSAIRGPFPSSQMLDRDGGEDAMADYHRRESGVDKRSAKLEEHTSYESPRSMGFKASDSSATSGRSPIKQSSKHNSKPSRGIDATSGLLLPPLAAEGDEHDPRALNPGKSSAPSKSLLEELFPEEAARLNTPSSSQFKELPQVDLEQLALPALNDLQNNEVVNRLEVVPRTLTTVSSHPLKHIPALLILTNAMPDLVDADFKRVSPKGRHIGEWTTAFGPSAIIPARESRTGEHTGKYYLVFDSVARAKEWRSRVEFLHRIAKTHTARSITSPIIPKKGFATQGEDIGETLREYSIFSAGVEPVIKLYSDPAADPTFKEEMKMILDRLRPSENIFHAGRSVLLWIDGWHSGSNYDIKRMLSVDGRARNLPWGGWGHQEIYEEYRGQIPLLRDDLSSSSKPSRRPKRWIVTLRDEAEARRFVRSWHMRPFPAWPSYKENGHEEPWPLVRTELMW